MGLKTERKRTARAGEKRTSSQAKSLSGLQSRLLASALCDAVLRHGRSMDEAQAELFCKPRFATLDHRDRALSRAIAATTLRRAGALQAVIDRFLQKPLPKKSGSLATTLLCAAAQLLILKTPAHAAISLAVEQVRQDRHARRFDKLVNAVARKVAGEGTAIYASLDVDKLSIPDWMWSRWEKSFGLELATRVARASLKEASLDLSVIDDTDAWADRLNGIALPTGSVRLEAGGRIEALSGFEDGQWWVQDAGAALPARLLRDIEGKRVLDMCAAPGGKTAQLCAAGARVTALDVSENRLQRAAENLRRLNFEAEFVRADAVDYVCDEPFDAVLLDAPCSATGTIRRHPDILHLKNPGDIEKLAALQARLIDAACRLTKPGGEFVYCTCSMEPEEGERQIVAALARHENLQRLPINVSGAVCNPDWITPAGDLRTLPCHDFGVERDIYGLDGFFAARLTRLN